MNSLLLCIPFAGLLLCIAVMPLVKPEWWEKHQALAVIVWSLLFIIPSIVLNGAGETTETVLECIVNDYLTFIVLLFGLFCYQCSLLFSATLIYYHNHLHLSTTFFFLFCFVSKATRCHLFATAC